MIITIAYWIWVLFISLALGWPVVYHIDRHINAKQQAPAERLNFGIVITTGWMALTVLGSLLSLVMAIDMPARGLVFGLAILVFFSNKHVIVSWLFAYVRRWWSWPWFAHMAWVMVILTALLKAVAPSENVDELGYHLPAVRWLEYYAVVPGTANLEDRLGFNAATNIIHALFSFHNIWPGGLYEFNSLLFVFFGGLFIHRVQGLWRGCHRRVIASALAVGGMTYIFRAYLTSLSPDSMIIYGGIYWLLMCIEALEKKPGTHRTLFYWWVLVWLSFLVSCKFSIALLTPVLFLFWLQLSRVRIGRLIKYSGMGVALVILPWLWRNYYISGYLIYPLYFLDVFSAEWKVPLEITQGQYHYVSVYAKTFITQFCRYNLTSVQFSEWFPIWNGFIGKEMISKLVLYGIPGAIALSVYHLFRLFRKGRLPNRSLWMLTLYLGVVSLIWFFRIPAMRFGWPWLLTCLVLGYGLALYPLIQRYNMLYRYGLVALLMLALARHTVVSVRDLPAWPRYLWTPAPVEPLRNYQTITIDGQPFKLSHDMLCRGAEPPCLPDCYDRRLRLRGERLEDGLYIQQD